MNITQKIQLLAALPLFIAMLLVILVTQHQFNKLSMDASEAYKNGVIKQRQQELNNYTSLALSSIHNLYTNDNIGADTAQALAKDVLTDLAYGEDGYFFAYTYQGDGVVHPKQPYRIGHNWWDLEDAEGTLIIQELIHNAQNGGDYLQYLWEKPSVGEVGTKMAYSVMLDKWDWMLGTGVYIDDIEQQVSHIQTAIDKKISHSSIIILTIGIIAVIAVYMTGLLLQFNEKKLTDKKLQALTKRILTAQEEERRRVSRELHDGIGQLLASAKFYLETATIKNHKAQNPDIDVQKAQDRIKQTLADLRRISRDLHPRILDDHGLSAGIESLAKNFSKRTGIEVNVEKVDGKNLLSLEIKTTLYRVAQEALTNIERHAIATQVSITITLQNRWIILTITDNGQGFDMKSLTRSKSPTVGIGLRNMQERLSYHKGVFSIESNSLGTRIEAKIPQTT